MMLSHVLTVPGQSFSEHLQFFFIYPGLGIGNYQVTSSENEHVELLLYLTCTSRYKIISSNSTDVLSIVIKYLGGVRRKIIKGKTPGHNLDLISNVTSGLPTCAR